MTSNQRLLILACSQRKRKNEKLLPAIERYNGPAYQITRKYLNTNSCNHPSIFILSAQYGLIAANKHIPYYNQKMTVERAKELKPSTEAQLQQIIEHDSFDEMLFCMGKQYQSTLDNTLTNLLAHANNQVTIAEGTIGKQGATLYDWLFKAPPPIEQPLGDPTQNKQSANSSPLIFRGKKIVTDRESLLAKASLVLQQNPPEAKRFESWYVLIGEQKVAPKWLFSLLTGLPVSQFRTADARRVLTALNIEVIRSIL